MRAGGEAWKQKLRAGERSIGLFLNAGSPTIAAQLSHAGYDWLLVDTQHGPVNPETLSHMITSIHNGNARAFVRVGGYHDRQGIQQALDLGADGILVPYINTAEEVKIALDAMKYPMDGSRSVYFPQRSMNVDGLLGYCGRINKDIVTAFQVETHNSIKNIKEIAAIPGVDLLFLGQNDLCMSMGLYVKYKFPDMYTSPELNEATQSLVDNAKKNNVILGVFLFGTSRVDEFQKKGFTFIALGNDLHHVHTQAEAHLKAIGKV
jgi:4-hydroxy-2-oxoheptanedioate aldolase